LADITKSNQQSLFSELTWGFKCILQALEFIHNQCSLIHGNLGPNAIFITPSGDWKLGAFELAANFNVEDDVAYFMKHQSVLGNDYISPERTKGDVSNLKLQIPPSYLDVYSYGKCMQYAFTTCKEELSGTFGKYIQLTIHSDPKKRPSTQKLITIKAFNSDYIKIMENIQEFNIKGPNEILEVMRQLDSLLPEMTVALCSHKLLPNLARVLQRAVNDFQLRDARETARQVRNI
jgi:SCY1-like protein 1